MRESSSGRRIAYAKVLGREASKQEKCKKVRIAATNKDILLWRWRDDTAIHHTTHQPCGSMPVQVGTEFLQTVVSPSFLFFSLLFLLTVSPHSWMSFCQFTTPSN